MQLHVKTHMAQGMKFILCGGTGFLLDLGLLTLFVEVAHIHPSIANLPAGMVSLTYVFLFNKYITFKNFERDHKQKVRFIMVYAFAFTANYLLFLLFLSLGVQYQLGKVFAVAIIATMDYLLSHHFIFKQKPTDQAASYTVSNQ